MNAEQTFGSGSRSAHRDGQAVGGFLDQIEPVSSHISYRPIVQLSRRPETIGDLPLGQKFVEIFRMRIVKAVQVTLERRLMVALENDRESERLIRLGLSRVV